ncbi:NAD(P)-dependent oxidoreductase [Neptunomonas marina]|uniref:NAD(P)-dependent oxidoreductase n=1 Tax=Neptunomonas marina TaxID=1815562 RepID=A0A437Q4G8_9GAMM|nr:NAD(P)-dependent oxidoreductase [Neptunomonas marina]RVU29400.1 NAD(P)-dependent oxidoreductase [Neptunomonas marina]
MKLTLIGTGLMGLPMAHHLLDAGFELTVWNRTPAKAAPLCERGAQWAETPEAATADADIVILMLENGTVVEHVLYDLKALSALRSGSLLIDMGSTPPTLAKKHALDAQTQGADYLDAPVSGGQVGAEQATLSIMVGGSQSALKRAQPVFNVLGKKTTYIGPAGSGQLAKCANQAIVGITIGAVSEALLLASAGGADPAAVREALLGGFADSRILELHGQRMIEREFTPGATSRVQLKDLRTILDTAHDHQLTLPLTQRTHDEYLALVNQGLDHVDHSGLLLQLEALNQPAKVQTHSHEEQTDA